MSANSKRVKLMALVLGFVSFAAIAGVAARSTGITGQSQAGATCHSATPDPTVSVTITGIPASYLPGNNYPLTISLSGGPTAGGGFDLSVTAGMLTTSDPNVLIAVGEATHNNPNFRTWTVLWTAPAPGAGTVTFHVAGNAVNLNGLFTGDGWNVNTYISTESVIDQRPAVSLTNPDGTKDWTGGSSQTLTWTMNDDSTPPANLVVYLNYSSTAVSGAIAGPLVGATSYPWTVPAIDVTDAKVNATVIDSASLKGYSEVLVPKIDSTGPTVVSGSPTGTSVGLTAPIVVQFSESMDNLATEVAFSISPNPGGWSFSWTQTAFPEDTLTATHANFQPSTTYTATISTQAKDISRPGNSLATQYQWSFTTFSGSDTIPPTVTATTSLPNPQETQQRVNVSALVQDNLAVAEVWLNVTLPGGSHLNSSMSLDSVFGRYYLNRTYDSIGVHAFTISASDLGGNWGSSSGQFVMQDTTAPAAPTGLAVQQSGQNALALTWAQNTEPDLAGYRVYRALTPGGPYTLLNPGALITATTFTDGSIQLDTRYYYAVTAVDASGSESPKSAEASGLVASPPGGGSSVMTIALLIVIAIVVAVIVLALMMRRKKPSP